jgi:tripartite-type tricarboxylate transporter receptor subunit TctC
MQDLLSVSVVIENRPGGNGAIAVSALLAKPADGYTLIVTEGSILYNRLLFANMPYDTAKLLPVAQVASAPMFLVTTPRLPVHSLKELVEYAKAHPEMPYGSAGMGSPHHLTMEALNAALGLKMLHVPYKGASESVPALLGGYVDVVFSAYPAISGFAKDKSVTLLATNALHPAPQAPDIPPIATIIPGFDTASIVGIYVQTGTPPDAVEKLSQAALQTAKDPDVAKQLFDVGVEAAGAPQAAFSEALAREQARIGKIAAEAHIQLQ